MRATYDVLTTTSAGGGYHEYFMGDEGALKMSENQKFTKLYREARAQVTPEGRDHRLTAHW